MMFYGITVLILLQTAYFLFREDSGAALRKTFLVVALFAPVWMTYHVHSVRLDFRIVQMFALSGLLILCPPRRPVVFRVQLIDLLMLTLVAALCASQFLSNGMVLLTPVDIACSWLPTYIVGRIYLQSVEDFRELALFAAVVFALVGVLSLVEAVGRTNPVNALFNKRFGILETGEGYRWGLKRAQGNLSHPIYHGFQLVLFLPFALQVLREARQAVRLRWLHYISVACLGAGVLVTVSRGAQAAYLISMGVSLFLMLPRFRTVLLTIGLAIAVSGFVAQDYVLQSISRLAGEGQGETRMIRIDGEEVVYTGTSHRWLLLKVYRQPLQKAGWFGWGGNLSGVEIDPELQQRFGSIDNHYVLFYLQYGLVGSILFNVIMFVAIASMVRVAWYNSVWRPMAAGLAGSLIALSMAMSSVWFAPDFAAIWLFNVGLAGNVYSLWSRETAVRVPVVIPPLRRIPVTQVCWGGAVS